MRHTLSLEGRRLLQLARAQATSLAEGPLAPAWKVITDALARGLLVADGADSVAALVAELESGGGMRIEDLAIEVSFDDPRGETLVMSLGGEVIVASRSGMVRELRRLWRSFRGAADPEEGEAPVVGGAAEAASDGEPYGPSFEDNVAAARVELKEALGKIGALLKERITAAAAKTDVGLGAAASATKERIEGAATSVRERVEAVLAALRDAAANAQAERDAAAPSADAASAAADEPSARAKDPQAMLEEARRSLGAQEGQGEGRHKLAEAVRRLGAHVPEGSGEAGAKVADAVRRFADWVESSEGGGAAIEGILGKLGGAFDEARAAATGDDGDDGDASDASDEDAAPGADASAGKKKRHLRLVPDAPDEGSQNGN